VVFKGFLRRDGHASSSQQTTPQGVVMGGELRAHSTSDRGADIPDFARGMSSSTWRDAQAKRPT
jgi:hypothetical protein